MGSADLNVTVYLVVSLDRHTETLRSSLQSLTDLDERLRSTGVNVDALSFVMGQLAGVVSLFDKFVADGATTLPTRLVDAGDGTFDLVIGGEDDDS